MSDVSVTAASVLASAAGIVSKNSVAGAAIMAGQVVYLDTDGSLKLSDANGSAAAKNVKGIALNGAAVGQPLAYVTEDPAFAPGFTPDVGGVYCLSANAGGIAPVADLDTGDIAIVLGVGIAGGKLNFKPLAGGVVPAPPPTPTPTP